MQKLWSQKIPDLYSNAYFIPNINSKCVPLELFLDCFLSKELVLEMQSFPSSDTHKVMAYVHRQQTSNIQPNKRLLQQKEIKTAQQDQYCLTSFPSFLPAFQSGSERPPILQWRHLLIVLPVQRCNYKAPRLLAVKNCMYHSSLYQMHHHKKFKTTLKFN